jgi:hypothetical protein
MPSGNGAIDVEEDGPAGLNFAGQWGYGMLLY